MNTVELLYHQSFQKLFEVRITHDFFLKRYYYDTNSVFQEDTSYSTATNLLANYQVAKFFDIRPTEGCRKLMRNHDIVFKYTSKGMIMLILHENDKLSLIHI